jgi:hypothetical protein
MLYTWRIKEIHEKFYRGNLMEGKNLSDLGIDGRSNKLHINAQSVRMLNGYI